MTDKDNMPQPSTLEDALQLARLKLASGPVSKPLLCFDTDDHAWCVVDCMIAEEIAWMSWLPNLKPITLATAPSLLLLLPCEHFGRLEALLLTVILEATGPPFLVDLILAAQRLPYYVAAKETLDGVSRQPTEVHPDDGGTVPDKEL
jgi:hypothetical protein